MFEAGEALHLEALEAEYYERQVAARDRFDLLVDPLDLAPGDREDCWVPSDAELAALVAADPARRRWPGDVVNDAEHAPITADLVAELFAVDPGQLDDAGRVGLAVAWSRVRNHADARLLEATAAAAGPDSDDPWDPSTFAWAELGAALRLGDGASTRLVSNARALTSELSTTLAQMRAGDVSLPKAEALVLLTSGLGAEQRQAVETQTLPRAAGRTPAQHRDAVRRSVDRVDPAALDRRRRAAQADIRLVRTHLPGAMGELFAALPSEELDVVWLAADTWARRRKAAGDERTLDQLRVAALVTWATSYLRHGDPTTCDRVDEPSPHEPPTRQGLPVVLNLLWDLPSYLGLTDTPGEVLGSRAILPPEVMRSLAEDAEVRRLLYDPLTGHLRDATPTTCRPNAALSVFLGLRDVNPTTPTAGPSPSDSGDRDHLVPRAAGGPTVADNLHSPTRRWHRAKTFKHFRVIRNDDGSWTWHSARTGRTYTTAPHDYRHGP